MQGFVSYLHWGEKIVRQIEIHHTLGSSNDFGKACIKSGGVTSGTVIWALNQISGRGRRGRTWESDGGSLTFSLLWRCPGDELPPALTLKVGLGLVMELGRLAPELKVKWPNDLCVGSKKLGGVLAETVRRGPELWVVVGVGINVNSTPGGREERTSLYEVGGCQWPRLGVLHCALEGIELGLELAQNGCDLTSLFMQHGNCLHRPLTIWQGERSFRARATAVLPDGSLLLEDEHGSRAFLPDEIRLVLV